MVPAPGPAPAGSVVHVHGRDPPRQSVGYLFVMYYLFLTFNWCLFAQLGPVWARPKTGGGGGGGSYLDLDGPNHNFEARANPFG